MKKFALSMFALVASAVYAEQLNWQIDQDGSSGTAYAFSYAKVAVTPSDGGNVLSYLPIQDAEGETSVLAAGVPESGSTGYGTEKVTSVFDPAYRSNDYSVRFELYDEYDTYIAFRMFNYDHLTDYLVASSMEQKGGTLKVDSFTGVPEPSCGLLVLLGSALLALRRRTFGA